MEKFRNKYRIPSARANWWNYSNAAWYFVTICTKRRKRFLGFVSDGEMNLSVVGEFAHKFWLEIPDHFPFVKLHAFVVMPNHVHGIIEIMDNEETLPAETLPAETLHATSVQDAEEDNKNEFMARISPKRGSLASIIRSYKSAVTKNARETGVDFAWQERFHDHIIRDDPDYHRITHYINDNPKNWEEDKFYK